MYDKLLASKHPNVQDSLNSWLPPNSGLREKIEDISRRHPNGFRSGEKCVTEGTELMDEMENRLRRVSNAITRCMDIDMHSYICMSFFAIPGNENSKGLEEAEASSILDAIHQREEDVSWLKVKKQILSKRAYMKYERMKLIHLRCAHYSSVQASIQTYLFSRVAMESVITSKSY